MYQATDRTNTTQFNAHCQIWLYIGLYGDRLDTRQLVTKALSDGQCSKQVRTAHRECEGGSVEAHSQVLCWRWCFTLLHWIPLIPVQMGRLPRFRLRGWNHPGCFVTVVVLRLLRLPLMLRAGLCPFLLWVVLDRLRSGAGGVAQEWLCT